MEKLFPTISSRLVDTIQDNHTFAVMSHIAPDGDAVFSSLAMRNILESLGKTVFLLSDGPFKSRDLKKHEESFSSIVTDEMKDKTEVVIVLDCSTEDRPGNVYQALKGRTTIVIDHHSSGIPFYEKELSYIIPSSPSTTLLVNEVRKALDAELDSTTARYLMTGFMTETGFFHFLYENQAPDSFNSVAEICSAGVSPYDLYDELHDGRRFEDLKVIGEMMTKAERYYDGRLIIAYEREEYETEERPGDTIYYSYLQVEGVKAVVLLKEKDGGIEFGFRAKNNAGVDVGEIAASLGGGGHRLASGARQKGLTFETARALILEKFSFLE